MRSGRISFGYRVIEVKTIEYYLELRYQMGTVENHRSIYVSLDELAKLLHCSTRNVKRLLKNMEKAELIYWKPGGGRGKRSKLLFRKSLEELLEPHIQSLVDQGQVKEAIRWLKREGIPAHVREPCYRYVLRALSFPRIDMNEMNRLLRKQPASITPTIVSTSTGRWLFVDRGHGTSAKK